MCTKSFVHPVKMNKSRLKKVIQVSYLPLLYLNNKNDIIYLFIWSIESAEASSLQRHKNYFFK